MCAILKFVETDAYKLLTIDAHLGHNFDDLPTLPSHAGFEGTSGSGTASAGVGGGSTALAIPVDNEAKSDSKGNLDDFIVEPNQSARQGTFSGKWSLETDVAASASRIVPKMPRQTYTLRSGESSLK